MKTLFELHEEDFEYNENWKERTIFTDKEKRYMGYALAAIVGAIIGWVI